MLRKGTLVPCQWECKLEQPWKCLEKLKIDIAYDPTILPLGIQPTEMKTGYQWDIHLPMVHWSIIHNSQDTGTLSAVSGRADKIYLLKSAATILACTSPSSERNFQIICHFFPLCSFSFFFFFLLIFLLIIILESKIFSERWICLITYFLVFKKTIIYHLEESFQNKTYTQGNWVSENLELVLSNLGASLMAEMGNLPEMWETWV